MIHLAAPWALLLLPLPWIIHGFVKPAVPRLGTALKVPFFPFIKHLSSTNHHAKSPWNIKKILAFIIWGLLVLALAGPEWLGKPVSLNKTGRNIMLLVDLSGSMEIPDMTWKGKHVDRLDVIKKVAGEFIDHRMGDRLGLVLFGTRAYLQTPLTFDRKTVQAMLQDASVGLAGPQTAIGDAIGLAVKRLDEVPKGSRVMVLLTDGVSNTGIMSPMQAAKIATQSGIKIYTIGMGSNHLVVPGLFGPQTIDPSQDLDIKTLQSIAKITGGSFFRAKDTRALQSAYKNIDKMEPVTGGKSIFQPIRVLYQWPLGLAFLFSLCLAALRLPKPQWVKVPKKEVA